MKRLSSQAKKAMQAALPYLERSGVIVPQELRDRVKAPANLRLGAKIKGKIVSELLAEGRCVVTFDGKEHLRVYSVSGWLVKHNQGPRLKTVGSGVSPKGGNER